MNERNVFFFSYYSYKSVQLGFVCLFCFLLRHINIGGSFNTFKLLNLYSEYPSISLIWFGLVCFTAYQPQWVI